MGKERGEMFYNICCRGNEKATRMKHITLQLESNFIVGVVDGIVFSWGIRGKESTMVGFGGVPC